MINNDMNQTDQNQILFKDKTKTWQDYIPEQFYSGLEDSNLELDIKNLGKLVATLKDNFDKKMQDLNDDQLLELFDLEEQISVLSGKISIYFLLKTSQDTQNQDFLKASNKFNTYLTDLVNQTLFIEQGFKQMSEQKLNILINSEKLKNWQYYLQKKLISKKYLLQEEVEKTINLKDLSGAMVLQNIYDEFTGAFEYQVNDKIGLVEEEVRAMRESSDEQIRKLATEALQQKYNQKANQIVLSGIYSGVVKDWVFTAKMRGFSSPIAMRNHSEELDDKCVQTLIEVVEKNSLIYQRFLKIKARLLNQDKLMVWNVLAPVNIEVNQKKYTFEELMHQVLEISKSFDTDFYNYFKQIYQDGRIDPYPNKGKRGGAYCVYHKNIASMVMLNITGELTDGIALAHELGHAIHGYYAQSQAEQNYDTPLCLAETASVFNQTLFLEGVLDIAKKNNDKQTEIFLLEKTISEMCNYIFKAILTTSFELEVHTRYNQGQEMSYVELNQLWREKNQNLNGNLIINPLEAQKEAGWSAIPHIFHTPFYNYSYSFGNLLSLALYSNYQDHSGGFVEKYKRLLQSGGSVKPAKILKELFGLDIQTADFYNFGLNYLSKLIDRLENLI